MCFKILPGLVFRYGGRDVSTAIDTTATSCPEERRSHNRANKHARWRRSPEYVSALKIFLEKNPWCEIWLEAGVKVRATEAHHVHQWSYSSFELFCDLQNNGAIAVSGSRVKPGGGHYAAHHHLRICPSCKKNKCDIFAEACKPCMVKKYPHLKEAFERAKESQRIDRNLQAKKRREQRNPFPCMRRGKEQRCKRKPALVCEYSRRNAATCQYFRERDKK